MPKSNKVSVDVLDESVQKSYQEIIEADQSQNKSRAQSLAILPEEAKQQIVEATKYSSYFPNPITDEFMEKYILAPIEFPTLGSGLAQSLTELNVRIDNLFNDAYTFEKAKLDSEELDLVNEELEEKLNKEEPGSIASRKLQNAIKKNKLEQVNKNHSLKKIELAAMARYNEAMGWKRLVEKKMTEMGVKDLSEVNFNSIRMDEMHAKIKKWGELHAKGALELTPSKFQAIDSNQQAFVEGLNKGALQIEQAKAAQEEATRQLQLASGVAGQRRSQ